jgi:hypothetical protein
MKFKQTLVEVFIFKNGMVAVFDERLQQMPFFQGRQDIAMPKIKSRIKRQKPCSVIWQIAQGVTWEGKMQEHSKTEVVKYE